MSDWTKGFAPGVYDYKADPRLSVRTYCECSIAGCHARWAVYWQPGDPGSESAVEGSLCSYLTEAKAEAVSRLADLLAR